VRRAAAGLERLHPGGGFLEAGRNQEARAVLHLDLVDIVQPDQVQMGGELLADLAEGPFESGTVEEDVGAGVEATAVRLERGGESAGSAPGLEDDHAAAP